jgi:hypothetical protein
LIADYLALISVCRIDNKEVYISKRALKHFVESRSTEMADSYENKVILEKMFYIIDNVEDVLNKHDVFQTMNGRYYFTKHFWNLDKPSIRIVLELIGYHFEIVTMHYKKTKNTTD